VDLLAEAGPTLRDVGAQLALLGTGDGDLERRIASISGEYPGVISSVIGFDEDLAHLVQAGADALVVPSRFEPCGLTQLYAMRYGAIPVVAKVGGLTDTIIDLNERNRGKPTGIKFSPVTQAGLSSAFGALPACGETPSNGYACRKTAWQLIYRGRAPRGGTPPFLRTYWRPRIRQPVPRLRKPQPSLPVLSCSYL
jgi:glycogen synthase